MSNEYRKIGEYHGEIYEKKSKKSDGDAWVGIIILIIFFLIAAKLC